MWSSVAGKMIETVWPGISELRTTAFRTGQYAGMSEPDFGPMIARTFKGMAGRGKSKGHERSITLQFPEWCRVTITRELDGKERRFVGPKVYWLEAYAKWVDTDVPNEMWANRPVGQLENAPRPERCAELSRKRSATRSPRRKWKDNTPLMARPMFRKSRSRKASRLRVPEGSASLSRRSCRNHSLSPHRHRPNFPDRSPPGKRAIPKSPMPARPHLNEDDTHGIGPARHPIISCSWWGNWARRGCRHVGWSPCQQGANFSGAGSRADAPLTAALRPMSVI